MNVEMRAHNCRFDSRKVTAGSSVEPGTRDNGYFW
jgi:hypothetical protein